MIYPTISDQFKNWCCFCPCFGSSTNRTGSIFPVFHLYCKTVLHAPVWIWGGKKLSLRFHDSVKAGLAFTSQQLNVNLPDKVFQRWDLFPGSESSMHLMGISFFLKPCLTPYIDVVRLISKDQGLQRSLTQMKMMHDFLFFRPDTRTQPLFLSLRY